MFILGRLLIKYAGRHSGTCFGVGFLQGSLPFYRPVFETESAVKSVFRGRDVHLFPCIYENDAGVRFYPAIFQHSLDQSHCKASIGNTRITDLVFADYAIILAKSLNVLALALEALRNGAKLLGFSVSLAKTKVQVLGGLMDEAAELVQACCEDIEVIESVTYLVVHSRGGACKEVLRRIGLACAVMGSFCTSIWRCWYQWRMTIYCMIVRHGQYISIWRGESISGISCLCRITRYRWHNCIKRAISLCN